MEEACKIIDKKLEKSGWVIQNLDGLNLEVAYIVTDTAAAKVNVRIEVKRHVKEE